MQQYLSLLIVSFLLLTYICLPTQLFAQQGGSDGWDEKTSRIRQAYLACELDKFGEASNIIYAIEYEDDAIKQNLIKRDRVVYNLVKARISKHNDNIEDAFKYINRAQRAYNKVASLHTKVTADLAVKNIPTQIEELARVYSQEFSTVVAPQLEDAYIVVKECNSFSSINEYVNYLESCLGTSLATSEGIQNILQKHFTSSDIITFHLVKAHTKKCLAEELFVESALLWESNLREALISIEEAIDEYVRLVDSDALAVLDNRGITKQTLDHLHQRIKEQLKIVDIDANLAEIEEEMQKIQQIRDGSGITALPPQDIYNIPLSPDLQPIRRTRPTVDENIAYLEDLKRELGQQRHEMIADSIRRYQNYLEIVPKTVHDILEEVHIQDPSIPIPCTAIEAIPRGEYGQDLSIILTYGGCDTLVLEGKEYSIGKYRTEGVDVLLLGFGKTVKNFLDTAGVLSTQVTGEIIGYADGHAIVQNALTYDGELGLVYNTPYYSFNDVRFKESNNMEMWTYINSNEQLAFLRAYYAQQRLAGAAEFNPFNLKLFTETSSIKSGEYRKVVVKLYIKDAHTKELNRLSAQIKEIIRNKSRNLYKDVILN